jgi:hypothetical protein
MPGSYPPESSETLARQPFISTSTVTTSIMASSQRYFYVTYAVLSALALYYMRLAPPSVSAGRYLEPLLNGVTPFRYPGRNTIMRTQYTGAKPIDGVLSTLVTAFLAGPAQWRKDIQVQQINFLVSMTSVLVVWSLESVRTGNRWNLIS